MTGVDDRERVRRILAGDQDEARDVVQQTFCRAIEKLDGFRGSPWDPRPPNRC